MNRLDLLNKQDAAADAYFWSIQDRISYIEHVHSPVRYAYARGANEWAAMGAERSLFEREMRGLVESDYDWESK